MDTAAAALWKTKEKMQSRLRPTLIHNLTHQISSLMMLVMLVLVTLTVPVVMATVLEAMVHMEATVHVKWQAIQEFQSAAELTQAGSQASTLAQCHRIHQLLLKMALPQQRSQSQIS